ncbi:MAG: hypothetical protein K8F91_13420, partial [Candidatus Obscuribacterales bacterium]|nr:hypothetical protein [Candidatus Obscuribacterales bacterium]
DLERDNNRREILPGLKRSLDGLSQEFVSGSRLPALKTTILDLYKDLSGVSASGSIDGICEQACEQAVISAYLQKIELRSARIRQENCAQLRRRLVSADQSHHYALGSEFAITALIALAAVARRRVDPAEKEPTDSPVCNSEVDLERLAAAIAETSGGLSGSLSDYMFATVNSRPTIIVGSADSLVSIAESIFHDPKIGFLIADINKHLTRQYEKDGKRVVEIRAGEMLELPVWEDIVEYCQNCPPDLLVENLITIVREAALNREILEEHLHELVSPAGRQSQVRVLEQSWPDVVVQDYRVTSYGTVNLAGSNLRRLFGSIESGIRLSRGIGD